MTIYRTDLPCRPIRADEYTIHTAADAARVFGDRYARRTYGKRGYCHHVRLDSYTQDGSVQHFQIFIGVPAQGGGTNGRNVFMTITVQD